MRYGEPISQSHQFSHSALPAAYCSSWTVRSPAMMSSASAAGMGVPGRGPGLRHVDQVLEGVGDHGGVGRVDQHVVREHARAVRGAVQQREDRIDPGGEVAGLLRDERVGEVEVRGADEGREQAQPQLLEDVALGRRRRGGRRGGVRARRGGEARRGEEGGAAEGAEEAASGQGGRGLGEHGELRCSVAGTDRRDLARP
jgi:hypothetical protein